MASNRNYVIPNAHEYKTPEMVTKLPSSFATPQPGPVELVDEIPSTNDYYDGSKKLNIIRVNCNIYANPNDCVKKSSCGWCGSSKSCVLGNNLGPLQACNKSTYIFSAPYPANQSRIINQNIGGLAMTVISK